MDLETLGTRIARERKQLHLSQQELAEKLSIALSSTITASFLNEVEQDRVDISGNQKLLSKISEFFSIDRVELVQLASSYSEARALREVQQRETLNSLITFRRSQLRR